MTKNTSSKNKGYNMTNGNRLIFAILTIFSVISLGCIYKEEFISETGKFISKSEKGKFNDLEITT